MGCFELFSLFLPSIFFRFFSLLYFRRFELSELGSLFALFYACFRSFMCNNYVALHNNPVFQLRRSIENAHDIWAETSVTAISHHDRS